MRIGDVNGNGIVYDENGELILQPGERLVERFPDSLMGLKVGWIGLFDAFGPGIGGGGGTLYVTDRRIVFIRHADYMDAGEGHMLPYPLVGFLRMAVSKSIAKKGGREFFEIEYRDISHWRRKRDYGIIYIIFHGKKYRCRLTGVEFDKIYRMIPDGR